MSEPTETPAPLAASSTDFFCPNCGYSLRGIASDRCPECGNTLEWQSFAASRIPWVHRKAIGTMRAYWRTVWLTMSDSRLISDEVQRPVSYEDAQKFRRMTVWFAFTPLAIAAAVGLLSITLEQTKDLFAVWRSGSGIIRFSLVLELLLIPVAWIALYLFVLAITGVQSYFFHPASLPIIRQNRAVALSYYACAPLAWTPLTAGVLVGFIALISTREINRMPLLLLVFGWLLGFGLVIVQTVGWWISSLRLLQRTTHCGAARTWTFGFLLPLSWVLLFAIIAVGIPAAYLLVCFVVLSLL